MLYVLFRLKNYYTIFPRVRTPKLFCSQDHSLSRPSRFFPPLKPRGFNPRFPSKLKGLSAQSLTARGPGISPGHYEHNSRLLSLGTKEKNPKGLPSCLIPRLLISYTQQLEILGTALGCVTGILMF